VGIPLGLDTDVVSATFLRDFASSDTIVAQVESGRPATRVAGAEDALRPEQILGTQEVVSLLDQPGTYTLVDARPKAGYDEGHIPSAISIYVEDLSASWDKLPSDKDRLVVFYCTGSS
jgi:3-mercaptopyruvate sulfurtransferase SseA